MPFPTEPPHWPSIIILVLISSRCAGDRLRSAGQWEGVGRNDAVSSSSAADQNCCFMQQRGWVEAGRPDRGSYT